jgi:hypothetical protein
MKNCQSSNSFSLLPASPKIFYGRESELADLVDTLASEPAQIAILGPGGMGKATLAMATLHHPTIVEKYTVKYLLCRLGDHHWSAFGSGTVSSALEGDRASLRTVRVLSGRAR